MDDIQEIMKNLLSLLIAQNYFVDNFSQCTEESILYVTSENINYFKGLPRLMGNNFKNKIIEHISSLTGKTTD